MANKRILRLTNTEAVIKIDGAVGSITIDPTVDLKLVTEDLEAVQKVNISFMAVSGKPDSVISVSRDGTNLWDLQANAATYLNLMDIGSTTDWTLSDKPITVTIAGAEGQLLMKLRKVSGYKTKIRIAETGSDTPV